MKGEQRGVRQLVDALLDLEPVKPRCVSQEFDGGQGNSSIFGKMGSSLFQMGELASTSPAMR